MRFKKNNIIYSEHNKEDMFNIVFVFTSFYTTEDIKGGLTEQNNQII